MKGICREDIADKDDAWRLGYAAGLQECSRLGWASYVNRRTKALQRDLFHERLVATRKPGCFILRNINVAPQSVATRMGSDYSSGDWMIRASYDEQADMWTTVGSHEKGICCVSTRDPHFPWEVLLITGANPRNSVLFVEPMTWVEAVKARSSVLTPSEDP